MKTRFPAFFVLALICGNLSLQANDTEKPPTGVTKGPALAKLGGIGELSVPAGYIFLDAKLTRAMLKRNGEPTSGHELGFLRPTNAHWSVFFEFSEIGYIKDAEKEKLNPDELLDDIKKGTESANKQREAAGNPPLVVVGWDQPPQYNAETHNLEWAVRATCEGKPLLNYNTRLLGRKGVMEVVLICDPEELPATLPDFRKVLADCKYRTGETYAEYRPGDKVAKYGLAALVVGGAALGAAKLGMFAWLAVFLKKGFKLIILALVAIASVFKKFWGKLTGRRDNS